MARTQNRMGSASSFTACR